MARLLDRAERTPSGKFLLHNALWSLVRYRGKLRIRIEDLNPETSLTFAELSRWQVVKLSGWLLWRAAFPSRLEV